MRVKCDVEEIEMESEDTGRSTPGVCVRCSRCDAEVEVFGTSERSIRRGLVMLREDCPNEENNFYVTDETD